VGSEALADLPTKFDSVQQVESELRSKDNVHFYEEDGWLIAESGFYLWSFTLEGHPAHPALVERQVYEQDGTIKIRTRQICKKSEPVCTQLSADFQSLNQNISQSIGRKKANNTKTIMQPGLEVTYDPEFGWSLTQRDYGLLVLIKRGPKDNESLVNSAQLFRTTNYSTPEEFFAAEVQRRQKNHDSNSRVENPVVSEKLVRKGDTYCVAYSYAYQDTGAVLANGDNVVANFFSMGLRCIHPFDNTIGVELGYSKRFFEPIDIDAHSEAARTQFNSIRFVPFPIKNEGEK